MISLDLKKGDEFELNIESLAFGGKGVGHFNNYVIFIRGGIPGQRLLVRLTNRRDKYGEGKILSVINDSQHSVNAPCKHFPTCGGCSFQHLAYKSQIDEKRKQVIDIFRRIGNIENPNIQTIIPADEIYHYRNKMEFSFSNRRWILENEMGSFNNNDEFALGLHIPKRFDKILDIDLCDIQKPIGNKILKIVRDVAKKNGLDPYDIKKHSGFLRNLIIRVGERTNEVMVNIVTSREDKNKLIPIIDRIKEVDPSISSIVNNINRRKSGVSYGEWEILLYGKPTITDCIGDFKFEISANSFFQTNTSQAENLYKVAKDFIGFKGNEILYDFYCGTGSTSIFMANNVKKVYGFEAVHSAIEDAERNAVSNSVTNCYFFESNLDKFFRESSILSEIELPDIVLIDPPRPGMHPKFVKDLIKMDPKKILYISCNPTTQARDIALLINKEFSLVKLGMVDMFPHTPHIETICLLEKN